MDLLNGYLEFKQQNLNLLRDRLKKFENGQQPHTLFITCSDSRIDPNLITNSKPGELFIIRNAGNYIASDDKAHLENSVISSMEFAINFLGIRNIVICGHSDCGAIKSSGADLSQTYFLKNYIPNFYHNHCSLDVAIEDNVRKQIENIRKNKAICHLDLKIEGWVYNVATGDLEILNPMTNQFESAENFIAIDMKNRASFIEKLKNEV